MYMYMYMYVYIYICIYICIYTHIYYLFMDRINPEKDGKSFRSLEFANFYLFGNHM